MTKHFSEKTVIEDKPLYFPKQPRILVAEDDDELRKLLTWSLHKEGWKVTECTDGMDLLSHLDCYLLLGEVNDFDLIISDICVPGITGIEFLEGLHSIKSFPPLILITAFEDEETNAQAQFLGAAAVFEKPFDIRRLLSKSSDIISNNIPFRNKRFLSFKKDSGPINFPLNVTFRHVLKSQQIVAFVRSNVSKLNHLSHDIEGCRVVIDKPHHHHKHGNVYHIRITLSVSGHELVNGNRSGGEAAHKNISVAISDAFDAMRHQLRIYLDKHRTHRNYVTYSRNHKR